MRLPLVETSPSAMELRPWIVLSGDSNQASVELWQLAESSASAVAIFSSRNLAEAYADQLQSDAASCQLLPTQDLIRVLAHCFQNDVLYAALDPDSGSCKKLFSLRDVLRAARENLIAQRGETPPQF